MQRANVELLGVPGIVVAAWWQSWVATGKQNQLSAMQHLAKSELKESKCVMNVFDFRMSDLDNSVAPCFET